MTFTLNDKLKFIFLKFDLIEKIKITNSVGAKNVSKFLLELVLIGNVGKLWLENWKIKILEKLEKNATQKLCECFSTFLKLNNKNLILKKYHKNYIILKNQTTFT